MKEQKLTPKEVAIGILGIAWFGLMIWGYFSTPEKPYVPPTAKEQALYDEMEKAGYEPEYDGPTACGRPGDCW